MQSKKTTKEDEEERGGGGGKNEGGVLLASGSNSSISLSLSLFSLSLSSLSLFSLSLSLSLSLSMYQGGDAGRKGRQRGVGVRPSRPAIGLQVGRRPLQHAAARALFLADACAVDVRLGSARVGGHGGHVASARGHALGRKRAHAVHRPRAAQHCPARAAGADEAPARAAVVAAAQQRERPRAAAQAGWRGAVGHPCRVRRAQRLHAAPHTAPAADHQEIYFSRDCVTFHPPVPPAGGRGVAGAPLVSPLGVKE